MSQPVQSGFRIGVGMVFGVIAAILLIITLFAAYNYKSPYQKWSDCVTAQAENGNYPSVCGTQP